MKSPRHDYNIETATIFLMKCFLQTETVGNLGARH
jgi:hypothetical protein